MVVAVEEAVLDEAAPFGVFSPAVAIKIPTVVTRSQELPNQLIRQSRPMKIVQRLPPPPKIPPSLKMRALL